MEPRKNRSIVWIISGVILLVVIAFLIFVLPNMMQSTNYLQLGDGIFKAQLEISSRDNPTGLSEVTNLDPDHALLITFTSQAKWKINISNMKIPIDIIWLNSDKKVVYIVKNASSDSSAINVFWPKLPAKYVVELAAGTVDTKQINLNSQAVFEFSLPGVK